MESTDLIALHPSVCHVANIRAWCGIQREGLLTSRDIVDLREADDETRARLLEHVRVTSTVLSHPVHGTVTNREPGTDVVVGRECTQRSVARARLRFLPT